MRRARRSRSARRSRAATSFRVRFPLRHLRAVLSCVIPLRDLVVQRPLRVVLTAEGVNHAAVAQSEKSPHVRNIVLSLMQSNDILATEPEELFFRLRPQTRHHHGG